MSTCTPKAGNTGRGCKQAPPTGTTSSTDKQVQQACTTGRHRRQAMQAGTMAGNTASRYSEQAVQLPQSANAQKR